jgi:hypothetical protein
MDARLFRAVSLTALVPLLLFASLGAGYRTTNFVVDAPTPEFAEQIGKAAEKYRHDLAIDWLGSALPNWPQPCPIHVQAAPNLGAGGATSFMFDHGEVFGWQMNIQGSEERLLDSVLPHEVTHTIFATHFRRPLPRWADEGACTTVEHVSERAKQERLLIQFLRTGRGIAFSTMFAMTEYPQDILPLYSQGYSLAKFLIDQKGRREFIAYVNDGMNSGDWTGAGTAHYGYKDLAVLQDHWLDWVKQGSPLEHPMTTVAGGDAIPTRPIRSRGGNGSSVVIRAQAADHTARDSQPLVPIQPTGSSLATAAAVVSADERRPAPMARTLADNRPIRNGSVAIDYGEPAGAPPLPAAIPARASQPYAVASAAPAGDGSWHGAATPSATSGHSVYGDGVGLVQHSDEAASGEHGANYPAERQHKLLEWSRE